MRNQFACPLTAWALLLVASGLAVSAAASTTGDFQDFNELNLEDLLNQVVVTASKHEQKISESPMAATVITAEQIAASGATSIPELLRDVPGLDVIRASASQYDVSARGLNELGSNSILVLVDGRSVYADFYGLTLWDFLAVAIDEIKVIEVIKGPSSAFYGANAFACVVNIITFRPEEIDGTIVRAATSSYSDALGSVVHGGTHDRLGWRLSTSFRKTDNWVDDVAEGEMARFNGHLEWQTSAESRVALAAGFSDGNTLFVPASENLLLNGRTHFLRADYKWRDLELRWFTNQWSLNVDAVGGVTILDENSVLDAAVHDFELRHVLHPGGGHFLQWGGEFRRKTVDWTLMPQAYDQNIYSAFIYDEWRRGDHLLFSMGLRYDDHPLVGGHLAPRGGIVYKPSERHALRATYGVAYRDPTYLENYWLTEITGFIGYNALLHGERNLDSEQIRSFEVGYQGLLQDNLMVAVAVYHNNVRDFIDMDIVDTFPSPPAPIPGIPSEIAFLNDDDWNMTGGELSCESRLSSWLQGRAHWAFVWAEQADSGERVVRVPRHTAGVTLNFSPHARHNIEWKAHYKSGASWTLGTISAIRTRGDSAERVVVDARWHAELVDDTARVVLGVENLFDRRYRDHPLALQQQRRFIASLLLRF